MSPDFPAFAAAVARPARRECPPKADAARPVAAGVVDRLFDVSDLVNLLIEAESKKAA